MSSAAQVLIHPSQFPDQVRRDLLESLRTRRINHKFLYDGVKQTQKWLALHEACSPARTDPDCLATYEKSFRETAAQIRSPQVRLIGLGCGGGQKDVQLLEGLQKARKTVSYMPVDVSAAMVLVAREAALVVLPADRCSPVVLDLALAEDLAALLEETSPPQSARLVSFFGMLPNFEPGQILPRLSALLREDDFLLLSANLAPGTDYREGVQRVLPLYDNKPTREWLMGFLLDLGIEQPDGALLFAVEDDSTRNGLKRIAAYYEFRIRRELRLDEEVFSFRPGERVRVFFSYRHTPALVERLLRQHGLDLLQQWITPSGEEGVFLAVKRPAASPAQT